MMITTDPIEMKKYTVHGSLYTFGGENGGVAGGDGDGGGDGGGGDGGGGGGGDGEGGGGDGGDVVNVNDVVIVTIAASFLQSVPKSNTNVSPSLIC